VIVEHWKSIPHLDLFKQIAGTQYWQPRNIYLVSSRENNLVDSDRFGVR